jgi:cytochrome oxidase Cu insertion factor (SCO1/SenC/PrrC family)
MNNKMTLTLLISIFALPPLLAYFMYFTNIMPERRSNKGVLVNPLVSLAQIDEPLNLQLDQLINNFAGKWTLLMLSKKSCQSRCQKNIYLMRQVYSVLGKNNYNVRRVLILENVNRTSESKKNLKNYPKMSVVNANKNTIERLIMPFNKIVNDIYLRIFIIDPHGRVILYYPANFKPKDLLSDLKRLVVVNNNSKQFNRGFF